MAVQLFSKGQLLSAPPATFSHPVAVRFQDLDAAGVVFFARILEYFHDAYLAFLAAQGCPLPQVLAEQRWIAPLVHAEADFLSPLTFGQTLRIELPCASIQGNRLVVGYRALREGTRDTAATGQTVHAFLDGKTRQSMAIPEPLAQAFRSL